MTLGAKDRIYQSMKASASRLGVRSLPTCFNGQWLRVPVSLWSGFRWRYEPHVARALRERLKPGDTFADVGAHAGWWSLFAGSMIGVSGVVFAFEPAPLAFESLAASMRYCRSSFRLYKVGVGSRNSMIPFFPQGASSTGSFFRDITRINEHCSREPVTQTIVHVRTLDSLADEMATPPAVIKVDVEGYELEVLKGARRLLAARLSAWVIEVHPPQLALSGGSEPALTGMLEENGYAVSVIDRNPNSIYTLFAC